MENNLVESALGNELLAFIASRQSLQLASITAEGLPYASYAPFGIGDNCLYVLLSEIAVHAINLQQHPRASVLIIEDEDTAVKLFARKRVNYAVLAEPLAYDSADWQRGMQALVARHGEQPRNLGNHADFKMFRLVPQSGRYVKDFGRAYALQGETLAGGAISHLRDGHKARASL